MDAVIAVVNADDRAETPSIDLDSPRNVSCQKCLRLH